MDLDDNTLCECGESIEEHRSVGQYLMCPDNIHEFEPARCDKCGEPFTTRSERAEVVDIGEGDVPIDKHLIVHFECYRATPFYKLA